MKTAACIIAIVGMAIGVLTATIQNPSPLFELFTVLLSVLGAVGGVLTFFTPRVAIWLLFIVAVVGTVPDTLMWEGAGSFFLVSALLGLTSIRQTREA